MNYTDPTGHCRGCDSLDDPARGGFRTILPYAEDPLEDIAGWATDHPWMATGLSIACEVCDWGLTIADASVNGLGWRHTLALVPIIPFTIRKLGSSEFLKGFRRVKAFTERTL